ncbi:polyprenyl synthetase family protein [Nitrosophilus alvini]|uniref:polyprenyl synthetase family protein n=1 Tax=Nitrosophilus alvini TaxID=2714855 RepID=UPI00190D93E9|nr:polyprenyl synthetase family protein [Nitrosophilus alvini]
MNRLNEQFEKYLLDNLPKSKSFHPHFEKALQQMLVAGGKRFRPLLVLSVTDALQPLLLRNALPVAYAIELLHTYSLIHDDLPVFDNADLRRGMPTLHKTYDEVTAILVGDALNTHAFFLLADAPLPADTKVEIVKELAREGGIEGMIIGQAIDCWFEKKKLALDELKFLHIHKTAKLIAASLKIGAIICNEKEIAKKLYDFGIDLGLLFQIQDDLIDALQDDTKAGKTTSNDENKNSFVNLLGIDGAMKSADELVEKLETGLEAFDTKLKNNLKKILNNYLYRHKNL